MRIATSIVAPLVVATSCAIHVPRDQATVEREMEAFASTFLVVHGVAVAESTCTHDAPPAPGAVSCDEGATQVVMNIDWAPNDERLALDDPLLARFTEGAVDKHDLPGYHGLGRYGGIIYDDDERYSVRCGATAVDASWGTYVDNFLLDSDVLANGLDPVGLREAIQRGVDLGQQLEEYEFVPGCREDSLPPEHD